MSKMAQVMKSIGALHLARHPPLSPSSLSPSRSLSRISRRFYAKDAERNHVNTGINTYLPGMVHALPERGFSVDVGKTRHEIHSRTFYSNANASSAKLPNRVFAPYTVFKGKAALSVSPVLPTFKRLDSGDLQVDRRGVIMIKMWPAIGERKYDWEQRQSFALSATEVGSLISLGPKDSCEFFHDPSMKSSEEGQVRKSLSIKANADGSGYFISLTVANNMTKTNDRLTVPVTTAELAVIRSASSFALPHILGWGRFTNQTPIGSTFSAEAPPQVKESEWDR